MVEGTRRSRVLHAMLQQVGAQNADIIVRDVCERGTTFHIPQRVDARYIRFQLLIHRDVPPFGPVGCQQLRA